MPQRARGSEHRNPNISHRSFVERATQSTRTNPDESMLEQVFSMKDKTFVITVGSRGLGFYMAKGFFAAGAT